jgi:hypothetical protein
MITTTLNKIRDANPCVEGWKRLLNHLGKTHADDEPLPLLAILKSNGLEDTLWCLRTVPEHDREWRLFAVWCARRVQHLMSDRSISALDCAERFANGAASLEELQAAEAAAWAAAGTAARAAAVSAAVSAAWAAAVSVAEVAARAARAAVSAAGAAGAAADAAAEVAQEKRLREIIS